MLRSAILVTVLCASAATAQTNLYTYLGQGPSYALGSAVVNAGDVDGDGINDYLLGVPHETTLGTVRMVSGATGTVLYSVHGTVATGQFGFYVARIGDVDFDGKPDFAVGDTAEVGPNGMGSVHVFSGANGALLYVRFGYSPMSYFGYVISGIGDIDGDGAADFLVGSTGDTSLGHHGTARLFSGASGALMFTVDSPTFIYGAAVAGLGDVDGDGVPDFAVSSPSSGTLAADLAGLVTVFSGATHAPLYNIFGPSANMMIGSSVTAVGDVDGDGRPDILIGGEGYPGMQLTGTAYLHSGATGALLHSFSGDSFYDRFGCSVADVGDVDQDGWPDVAIGSRIGNYVKVYSGASGAGLFTMRETNTGWMSPMAVAGLGDLNGDGRPEIAIGSSTDSTNGQFSGRARVVSNGFTPPAGPISCFGDGSAGPCPCGNTSLPGAGCANSSGVGAALEGLGSTSVADDLFFLEGTHLQPNTLAVLFSGTSVSSTALEAGGDGLRCIGGAIKRVKTLTTNQVGSAWFGPTLHQAGGWNAGESRHFQVFYRNPNGPCLRNYNVSNAASVTFTP